MTWLGLPVARVISIHHALFSLVPGTPRQMKGLIMAKHNESPGTQEDEEEMTSKAH